MLGLFNGRPGARAYRRHLSTAGTQADADLATLQAAIARVSRHAPAPGSIPLDASGAQNAA
jgi:tRNA-dihydrouridine synthase A